MDAALNLPREPFSSGVRRMVAKAARALFGESNAEAEAWVGDRLLALLTGRSGGDIVKTIHWWASRRKLDESALKMIETACNYLADRTRTRLMHYAEALRDGLPIATGVIEVPVVTWARTGWTAPAPRCPRRWW
jgi:hypothetical protein